MSENRPIIPKRQKLVVLSGAGISAESGLRTFRGKDGYWRDHSVMQLATPQAWNASPQLVLDFYNERRRGVIDAEPNAAHKALVDLESDFDVVIVTQNVDDLHERAGSSHVIHLHGEIMKSRSSLDHRLVYDTEGKDIAIGDLCERGSQLRPHIVWFGEDVPLLGEAVKHVSEADVFIVVGTSLSVYPAAGLVDDASPAARKFLITLESEMTDLPFVWLKETACIGVPRIRDLLLKVCD